MPREIIRNTNEETPDPGKTLQIGWNKIGWVQLSLAPDGWETTGDWDIVDLRPKDVDKLIKVLKKAKRQAYSEGSRHHGYWDNDRERLEYELRAAELSDEDKKTLRSFLNE